MAFLSGSLFGGVFLTFLAVLRFLNNCHLCLLTMAAGRYVWRWRRMLEARHTASWLLLLYCLLFSFSIGLSEVAYQRAVAFPSPWSGHDTNPTPISGRVEPARKTPRHETSNEIAPAGSAKELVQLITTFSPRGFDELNPSKEEMEPVVRFLKECLAHLAGAHQRGEPSVHIGMPILG